MAGLKEIAQKCSVSLATVSRVLNADQSLSVSPSVRESILKEAEAIGYKTPRQRKASAYRVGLILSPIDKFGFENNVLEIVSSIASEMDISVEIFNPEYRHWNGLMILGEYSKLELDMYSSYSENILLINNLGHEEYKYDSLMMDYSSSERQLINHFISLEKKSIGYFGGVTFRDGHVLGNKRAEGFKKLLLENGLFQERYYNITRMEEEAGYSVFSSIEEVPEAIVFSDPEYARGAMRAIRERKLNTYTICYDNFGLGTSTCDKNLVIFSKFLWTLGVKHLLERIKGDRTESIRIYCPAAIE